MPIETPAMNTGRSSSVIPPVTESVVCSDNQTDARTRGSTTRLEMSLVFVE